MATTTERRRTIGYVRVSTEQQADSGLSLDAQTEKVRAMAVVRGTELAELIVDAGESAKSLKRPGMTRLLALVDAGQVDCVIIAKLDRLTRSVADLAELLKVFERRNVSLVSVADALDTQSAAGRLVLNIMVSVSQWEREAIGERTRDALSTKRRRGERISRFAPYGHAFSPDGRLAPCADEQSTLALMTELRTAGSSLPVIAAELNRRGITTRSGELSHPLLKFSGGSGEFYATCSATSPSPSC